MSDTPKTDAATVYGKTVLRPEDYPAQKFVPAEVAQQLERENAELRRDKERLTAGLKRIIADFDELNGNDCSGGCGECARCIAQDALNQQNGQLT